MPNNDHLLINNLIHFTKFILRSREKEELIRRLSRNQATADIFKNTKNIRKFSTVSLRGDQTTGSLISSTIGNNDRSLSNCSSSHHSSKTGSVLTTGSILTTTMSLNPEQIQDPTKLRNAFLTGPAFFTYFSGLNMDIQG